MAPSPITQMTLLLWPERSRAVAMPRPAEIEVDECAAPNGVVTAFGAFGEAGKAVALSQRTDAVAPSGQDLVRVGLMADVPDQTVARRVEHVMQRDRQLDDPKARAEMAACHRDGIDRLGAQLIGDLRQLRLTKPAKVFWCMDCVSEAGWRRPFPTRETRMQTKLNLTARATSSKAGSCRPKSRHKRTMTAITGLGKCLDDIL